MEQVEKIGGFYMSIKKYVEYTPCMAIIDNKLGSIIRLNDGIRVVKFSGLSKSEKARMEAFVLGELGRKQYLIPYEEFDFYEICVVLDNKEYYASFYNNKNHNLFGNVAPFGWSDGDKFKESIHILHDYLVS